MQPTRVLFLCTGNSARSILAEMLLRELGGSDFEVLSAGTEPKGVNPLSLKVLEQAGLPFNDLTSNGLDEFTGQRFDYLITVCDRAAEQCPVFPGNPERILWSLPDPAAVEGDDVVKIAAFKETLRDMRRHIETFVIVARRSAAGSGV